jgi:hypothetical protein
MPRQGGNQPGLARARGVIGASLWLVALASCAPGAPATSVQDLNWACGPQRCTATFKLSNDGPDDEALRVFVRAYAGESVARREIVGEHREQVRLHPGQSRRFDVRLDVQQPANRLRVVIERAAD